MKPTHPAFISGLAAVIVPACLIGGSGTAFAQGRGAAAGESGGASAASPPAASSAPPPSSGAPSSGSTSASSPGASRSGQAVGRGESGGGSRTGAENPGRAARGDNRGDSGRARYDGSSGSAATGGTAAGRGTPNGGVNRMPPGESGNGAVRNPDVPPYSRPRNGQPTEGTAVPRTSPPPTHGDGVPSGIYLPWGFGGFGMYGLYDPYYDPWDGGPYYPPPQVYGAYAEGSIKLKVKPREASVFVDGYYVGIVDDFDGLFQRLHVAAGPHRVEISAPGYETLSFDVRVPEDETVTYRGELQKLP